MSIFEESSGAAPYIRIRLMSPLGRHPRTDVKVGESCLIVRDDIAFSAVLINPQTAHGLSAEHYSEVEIYALEEVRFFSCLALSLHPDNGMVWTYPLSFHKDLTVVPVGGGWDEAVLHHARILAATTCAKGLRIKEIAPTPLSSAEYERHQQALDEDALLAMLRDTKLNDWLALRGLGALLLADMLWQHREFGESAIMALHVAMEASFEIVREIVRAQGNPDPSAHDAGAYLDKVFNPDVLTGPYFGDWYEVRIKTSHPSSRFGEYPFPPLQADDYFDLRYALHQVFFYLLTGEVRPK